MGSVVRTVLVGERPQEVEDLLARRRALGQDLFDEVWEGEYHVAPAPHWRHSRVDNQLARLLGPRADAAGLLGTGPCNIGTPANYRVPDQAYFAAPESQAFNQSAVVVVEIVSPGDESRMKFDFYFGIGVDEVLVIDPEQRTVEWFVRSAGGFVPASESARLGLSADELVTSIDWPQ